MRIVLARRGHIPGMTRLMAVSPLLHRYGVTVPIARRALLEGIRERDLILVALEDDDVVGLAWTVLPRALDRAAYLRLLLVAEGQQSRGLGAALLMEAERRARAAGSRHLVLLVTTTNRRARTFYVRNGYRHVGSLPGFVRPGIGESLYAKTWRSADAGRKPATAGASARRRSPSSRG
jgi:GNAT superfamily N-acetyltransferase